MSFKRYFKKIAPGLITGGADNDPAGITTYSISGAIFGFGQLWLMVLATPMLIAIQSTCSRIGNVRRKGLSYILREEFHPSVAWLAAIILAVSNVVTIGADIVAVALAFQMITGIDLKFWVLPVTLGIWYLVLFKNFKSIRKFFLWMIAFFVAYIVAAVLAKPDWSDVVKSVILPPLAHQSREFWVAAVGILGTTITPYLFFWQVKEEIEERKSVAQSLRTARHEDGLNAPGFMFSQVITIFIMIATGATLFQSHVGIATAADAAKALEPVAGQWASYLFAIGIIGAGLLAVPVLSASTAYVLAETAQLKHDSLNNKIKSAKGFYAIITLSLLAGMAVLVSDISPLKALYYSQVLAGLLAPLLLVLILIIANRKKVMGEFTSGWFDNVFTTLAVLVMTAAVVCMFI